MKTTTIIIIVVSFLVVSIDASKSSARVWYNSDNGIRFRILQKYPGIAKEALIEETKGFTKAQLMEVLEKGGT